MKKFVFSVVAVFILWSVLDFVIHGVILGSTYADLPQLFRPMTEMKMPLLYFVTLISALAFVYIYAKFVSDKSMRRALGYGALMGVSFGISMGYGTYSSMPIPYHMAFTWFLGTLVELTLGGLVLGLIFRE